MDSAQRWLRANDPRYKEDQAKKLRKREERRDYYQSIKQSPPRSPLKKFPLK